MRRTDSSNRIIAIIFLVVVGIFIVTQGIFAIFSTNEMVMSVETTTDYASHNIVSSIQYLTTDGKSGASILANESQVVSWATGEAAGNAGDVASFEAHLAQVSQDFNLDGLSYASASTENVYASDGTTHAIDPSADEDAWWAERRAETTATTVGAYDDGSGAFRLYVTSTVTGEDGAVLGYLRADLNSAAVEAIVRNAQSLYDLETAIVDGSGNVLLTNSEERFSGNVYDEDGVLSGKRDFVGTADAMGVWLSGSIPLTGWRSYCLVTPFADVDLQLVSYVHSSGIQKLYRQQSISRLIMTTVTVIASLFIVIDLTRRFRQGIVREAMTDELTGLYSRKAFFEAFQDLEQEGKLVGATVFFADMDKFKHINDTYGHAAGDEALKLMATELRRAVGDHGVCGRWGGDEFVGLFTAEEATPRDTLDEVRMRLTESDLGRHMGISMSGGISDLYPGESLQTALDRADVALYSAKRAGRGKVRIYQTSMQTRLEDPSTPEGQTTDMLDEKRARHRRESCETLAEAAAEKGAGTEATAEYTALAPDAEVAPARLSFARDWSAPDFRGGRSIPDAILEGVNRMIPFAVGGGVLMAVAFLADAAGADVASLTAEEMRSFGSITPFAATLNMLGSTIFQFLLPVFGAFAAAAVGGYEAFVPGFASGYLASQGGSGFLGTLVAALLVAQVVKLMKRTFHDLSGFAQVVVTVLVYPLFSLLLVGILMNFVVGSVCTVFNGAMTSLLEWASAQQGVVFGMLSGAMMGFDLGGPVNKAAYNYGTSMIPAGQPWHMAAVMAAGMVPPCGMALSTLLFRDKFNPRERANASPALVMGLSFITEGAIPYVLADLPRAMPASMLGAATAGALSELFGCTLLAPHGGIFVVPLIGNPWAFLGAVAAGSLVTALVLGLAKPKPAGTQEATNPPSENSADERCGKADDLADTEAES